MTQTGGQCHLVVGMEVLVRTRAPGLQGSRAPGLQGGGMEVLGTSVFLKRKDDDCLATLLRRADSGYLKLVFTGRGESRRRGERREHTLKASVCDHVDVTLSSSRLGQHVQPCSDETDRRGIRRRITVSEHVEEESRATQGSLNACYRQVWGGSGLRGVLSREQTPPYWNSSLLMSSAVDQVRKRPGQQSPKPGSHFPAHQ
ncbi:uncharacterized protein LOC134006925 [Osmerus eperlanus]|uniref:uncharacterized protein LOC134006925 n=1 Tax=Osmerus eperlanus TaxID=29151 RepID=UPI002E163BFB